MMEIVHISADLVEDFGDAPADPTNPSFGALRRAVADLLRAPQSGDETVRLLTLALQTQADAAAQQFEAAETQVPSPLRPLMQPRITRTWEVLQQMEDVLETLSVWLDDPRMDVLSEILGQLDRITQDAASVFEQMANLSAP